MNYSICSDGTKVSQATIDRKYAEARRNKYADMMGTPCCEACGESSVDNDHTIAQARCKVIHKTELIWDPKNFPRSCRKCHHEWENVKGLKWVDHANVDERLRYLRKHDPEGYKYRMTIAA
jgi:hypothetical protein